MLKVTSLSARYKLELGFPVSGILGEEVPRLWRPVHTVICCVRVDRHH